MCVCIVYGTPVFDYYEVDCNDFDACIDPLLHSVNGILPYFLQKEKEDEQISFH